MRALLVAALLFTASPAKPSPACARALTFAEDIIRVNGQFATAINTYFIVEAAAVEHLQTTNDTTLFFNELTTATNDLTTKIQDVTVQTTALTKAYRKNARACRK